MDEVSSQSWFLRKHQDGAIFGPISFEQLATWASAEQVAPQDVVSTDQETWLKAPMLSQLAMDWLVEVTSEHFYGPTTVGAIQEFIRLGDINADTIVINTCDGNRRQIRELPALFRISAQDGGGSDRHGTGVSRDFESIAGTDSRSGTNIARRTARAHRG